MIKGFYHTGFVVENLAKSTEFYRDVIGLQVVRTAEREGYGISQLVGYEDAHLKVVLLNAGNGHELELIQYINQARADRPSEERATLGASHLAFYVDDMERTFQHLIDHGAKMLNPPVESMPGVKACYLQDPDGNWLELIEGNIPA